MNLLIATDCNDKPVSTCNHTCYNSEQDKCTCICNGLHHGIGFKRALESLWQSYEELTIQDFKILDNCKLNFNTAAIMIYILSQQFPECIKLTDD